MQTVILANCNKLLELAPAQQNLAKKYVYWFQTNYVTLETELCIRKTQFTDRELTAILLMFPYSRLLEPYTQENTIEHTIENTKKY